MSEYQKINKNIFDLKNSTNNDFLNLYLSFNQLKNILRTGWIKYHDIEKEYVESVSDHIFSSIILGYGIAKELNLDLDFDKLIKLLLFHEVGEIYAGDLVSKNNRDTTKGEQSKKEKEGIEKILGDLRIEREIKIHWEEFESAESKEAKFANSIDSLEAVFQAWVYKKSNLVGDSVLEFKEHALEVAKKNNQKEIIEILNNVEL